MPVGDILVQYSVTPCVFYALCVIMTDVHQGQWCKQLERRVLLAEKRTVVQRRAERRMGGQTVFFIFALLRLQTLFLPLCAPVLKPDLYLSLGQAHGWGDGVSLQHRQVVALLKALLQNLQLLQGEWTRQLFSSELWSCVAHSALAIGLLFSLEVRLCSFLDLFLEVWLPEREW